MNQIAASLLILSASILGHTVSLRTTEDGFGGILGLVAIGLGLWGGMALLSTTLREREGLISDEPTLGGLGTSLFSRQRMTAPTTGSSMISSGGSPYGLSPETSARLAATAQLRGQDRQVVVEETLRRHLPKSTSGVAA